ncbi:hypothetical protein PHMEG_0001312 [Phytophthora megakarya]|uniref:Uncharacterized protein n=1 Tax=Phytophthora megakarya TaxID=4795 RepID=A0A225X0U1_9STRA|nr:hypothetical protein PHMEG_0001312 [Phytophthora megakarya]
MFTISEKSMWHMFPHLFEGTPYEQITAKLRGERLVLQRSVRFEWDDDIKQVTCIQIDLDMLSAVMPILPDLEDIAFLFSKALITPECGFTLQRSLN